MELLEKHKALIITFLISGIIVFAMFSFSLTKKSEAITESYYEMEPQTIEELKEQLEEIEAMEKSMSTTNQAFNEDQEFKEMMKNFKSMNSNDFEKTTETSTEEASQEPNDVVTSSSSYNSSNGYSVNKEELSKFKKAKDILAMRSPEKREKIVESNTNSSVSYSLKGRNKEYLPPPVYLCEESGKVVVNITVNANGDVLDTYINSSSTSDNECLVGHALEYAKTARFNASSNTEQIGSITYYFKAKN